MSDLSSKGDAAASDIVSDGWVVKLTPTAARPYIKLARMDRPIGTWLLLFPCWWSLALAWSAAGGLDGGPSAASMAYLAVLFAIGALVMRGAGCTYNDLVDRDIDIRVARTATRPIPAGQISPKKAAAFLAGQLLIGLAVLVQLNATAIWLGVASLGLVFAYPFMKRITYWPQAWLGLTFNWGALMGWAAVAGDLDWPPVLLYIAGIFWTLGYDTIYAHQDKEDDALVGVKSTALKFGAATKPWLIFFFGSTAVLLFAAGCYLFLGWPFWLAIFGVFAHFTWQIARVDLDNPVDCLTKFKSNRFIGWIYLAGVVAAGLLGPVTFGV
ncbi:MAG: 4-hydroxybenzoate octaprenyltransferase [Pseudomonadota bacterium]